MSDDTSKVGPGTILAGRYELTAEIGRGGFGMVYQARQLNMDRDVAIKVLPPQFMTIPDVVERFKREAKLASRLRHPNTITLHDYGQHEDSLFIAMELLTGEDVADVLRREGRIPPDRAIHIARQVLKSLSEAHEHNIVHRDLKPENIFLSVVGDDRDFVKVLDFGIAKLALPELGEKGGENNHRKLTMSGSTVGTPTYMSPEQAAGEEVDGQTDLYALGVILYELACGRPPFHDRSAVQIMRAHLFEEVPPLPDRSLHGSLLEKVIFKALQKERGRRFKTANEFLLALAGEPVARPVVQGVDLSSLTEPSTTEWTPDEREVSELSGPDTGDIAATDGVAPNTDRLTGDDFHHTLQSADAVDAPESEGLDAIPFDALGENPRSPREKATVRSGVTDQSGLRAGDGNVAASADSSLVDMPPPGFQGEDPSIGSSILTVIEPGTPEDEVILLTNLKAESEPTEDQDTGETPPDPATARSAAQETDTNALDSAPDQDAPLEQSTAGTSDSFLPEVGDSTEFPGEDWSWGEGPVDTSSTHDEIQAVRRSRTGLSLMAIFVIIILAAAAWFFRDQITAFFW